MREKALIFLLLEKRELVGLEWKGSEYHWEGMFQVVKNLILQDILYPVHAKVLLF